MVSNFVLKKIAYNKPLCIVWIYWKILSKNFQKRINDSEKQIATSITLMKMQHWSIFVIIFKNELIIKYSKLLCYLM